VDAPETLKEEILMFQTIVFAYDGSAECRDSLEEGIALASRFNARCHLLAVVPPLPPMALAAGPLPEGWVPFLRRGSHAFAGLGWMQRVH
jgi:nucleotide-binding universal stress UspA family protein